MQGQRTVVIFKRTAIFLFIGFIAIRSLTASFTLIEKRSYQLAPPPNPVSLRSIPREDWKDQPKEVIPIVQVYIQKCPDTLRISLWQAKQKNNEVILIGDESCESFCLKTGVKFFAASRYQATAEEFDQKHFPTDKECWGRQPNPRSAELAAFQRWFILKEWMTQTHVPRVFYSDSDGMIYANVTEINYSFYAADKLVYIAQPPTFWTISFAFIDVDALGDFLAFVKTLYQPDRMYCNNDMEAARLYYTMSYPLEELECWDLKIETGTRDCLRHHRFSLVRAYNLTQYVPRYRVVDIGRPRGGIIFDNFLDRDPFNVYNTIANSSVYPKYPDRWFKQVTWVDNVPYFHRTDHKAPVLAAGLHFQGRKKPFMSNYMRNLREPCPAQGACSCTSKECSECLSECNLRSIDMFKQYLSSAEDDALSRAYQNLLDRSRKNKKSQLGLRREESVALS